MNPDDPPAGPDELERLFRRLVLNVAHLDPSRLDSPLTVADIHQNLVAYRTHRVTLGFDTNQDYEMTVLRLLAGERGYARVEPEEVRAALEHEAQAVNPDTGIFRRFGPATVHLEPDHVHVVLAEEDAAQRGAEPPDFGTDPMLDRPSAAPAGGEPLSAEPAGAPAPPFAIAPSPADAADAAERTGLPFSLEREPDDAIETTARDVTTPGAQCGYCGGELPVGRAVIFCPHCGQNVGVMHCPVCGTDLDVGWRYCITCGRAMAGLG